MLIEYINPNFEFEDNRGKLVQLVRTGWNQVNYIYSKKDAIRGKHYHKMNNEIFFVISGRIELILETRDRNQVERYILGDNSFFKVAPNIVHSFIFKEDTVIISMYDKGVETPDNTKDIFSL